jgi:hypothetical protein
MRVLIVNGFSDSEQGRRAFADFEKHVKEAFTKQRHFNSSHIEFQIADKDNIDQYLFEFNTPYLKREAEKMFDHLDFVFIDGDANKLPWLTSARKFLILIRMCKQTHKLLFASSFAMQTLVFL